MNYYKDKALKFINELNILISDPTMFPEHFVRGGSKTKILGKGWYFKVPFIDRVYIQEIRLRIIDMPVQTVSTKDGKTITLKAVLGYSIKDIFKLYNTMSHPESTLSGIVLAGISEHVKNNRSEDISQKTIEDCLLDQLKQVDYGIGDVSIKITSWADVKTFRLIQDASWMQEQLKMGYLGEKL